MKSLLLSIIIALAAGIQISQAQKAWDEIDYPEINNFERPEVEVFELDNGIKFYLIEDHELPLVNVYVRVRTGSVLDPAPKEGLASMTGTVMRSGGSENYPDDELNVLLENKAASMETGIGFSSGSANMNVLKEDFDELISVFVDLLQNPVFPEDKIELAKTQQKTSISRRNDDQSGIASREFRRRIYGPENVYGRLIEYETVDNITREDMVELHGKSFVGSNMMIGVIGDFEMQAMKESLSEAFRSLPAGEAIDLEFPEVNYEFDSSINFIEKSDVNQSYVLMGHIGGMRDNPDYAKLQLMNQVLSGGFSSRLFQVVRTEMGLAYSVFGAYGSNNFYPGQFYAGVMTQSETTAEAIDAIIEQIEKLQNEPVSEEELELNKDQFLNSLVFRYDSRSKILNERLSNEYAGLDPDAFERLVDEIRTVTAEDIQEVASEYIRPESLRILVVGNESEIGGQLEKYGEVNRIDITIPEPESDEETVAGDAEAGKEWLDRMAAALLPAGIIDGDLVYEADNLVQTPNGEMSIGLKQTYNFEDERMISDVQAPMGQVTMNIENGEGVMMMGGNEMPMPPQQLQQLQAEFERNYIYIALNRNELDAEYLGMEEMDGESYARIRINRETPFNLYLDPETNLPALSTYSQFNPAEGGRVMVKSVFNNWTESDGIVMAYEVVSYSNDEQAAQVVITSHTVE